MKTLIVTTDFSDSALNALNYACAFAADHGFEIMLTRIYTIPATYAGEGLSLVTINDALDADRELLKKELERVKTAHPDVHIEAKMVTGGFLESLQELKNSLAAAMIIMGAAGEYSELSLWEDDWLTILVTLSCPVLVIPQHIAYAPFKNIAFACDYKKICIPEQIDTIKKLVTISGAKLHVVHVTPNATPQEENKNTTLLKAVLDDVHPEYYTVENKVVIKGIAEFVQQHNIDLLLVIPHKHGLWYSLFNKSYTKQLARLNNLPVMAIHE